MLENTLIYYIIGDNGASAEGTMNGAFNEMANFNGMAALETPEFMTSKIDELGSPTSYNHYAVGWAWAMDAPFQWTKQVASHWGGTRNGTIVHWPNGIDEQGGLRTQFTHCIDIAPTILEAAGLPEPTMVNGVQQSPMEGTSMLYTFREPDAPERHDLQYFEMFGNRGVYFKGWSAVTKHRTPWEMVGGGAGVRRRRVGALRRQRRLQPGRNLAAEQPERLHELQRLWLIEAVKYNVLPIDDRTGERLDPEIAGPADPHPRQQPAVLRRHGPALGEQRREHQEQVVLGHRRDRGPEGGANGRDHRQGGRFGGWSLYSRPAGDVRLQRARHPALHDRGRPADPGREPTRCAWSSRTTAAGSRRAATSRSTTTARPSARAGSGQRSR